MGDMADFILEEYSYPDPDGMDDLRKCPKCGYGDCMVIDRHRKHKAPWDLLLICPKCGYRGDV